MVRIIPVWRKEGRLINCNSWSRANRMTPIMRPTIGKKILDWEKSFLRSSLTSSSSRKEEMGNGRIVRKERAVRNLLKMLPIIIPFD
jgi:hypothetical protein